VIRWANLTWLGVMMLLGAAACGRDAVPAGCMEGRISREAVSEAVSTLLYERNLIVDPEVHARMNEYILSASRDRIPADTVLVQFHTWLLGWVRDHPDRVEAARVAGGPSHPREVPSSNPSSRTWGCRRL
jgi:hypothetical protein